MWFPLCFVTERCDYIGVRKEKHIKKTMVLFSSRNKFLIIYMITKGNVDNFDV